MTIQQMTRIKYAAITSTVYDVSERTIRVNDPERTLPSSELNARDAPSDNRPRRLFNSGYSTRVLAWLEVIRYRSSVSSLSRVLPHTKEVAERASATDRPNHRRQ